MNTSLLESIEEVDGEIPDAMALTLTNVHEELVTLSEFLKTKLAEVSERERACSLREEAVGVQEEAVASSLRALQFNSEILCHRESEFEQDAELLEQRLNSQLVDQVSLERETFEAEKRRLQAKVSNLEEQLKQRITQSRSLIKENSAFKTHIRKMRKETKSLRADVMAKEEKLERMEFDMDNVKTKLRLNTLRREREQEQANDRVREREREVRSLLAQGTDTTTETSQLSFAGGREGSLMTRNVVSVEKGYVSALNGITRILLDPASSSYKFNSKSRSKSKTRPSQSRTKRPIVEDIISVFPGIASALGSNLCRADTDMQLRLLSLASHIIHGAYQSQRIGGPGLILDRSELAKQLMLRLTSVIVANQGNQHLQRQRKPPISPIGIQKQGFFEDEPSVLASTVSQIQAKPKNERLLDSKDVRVRTVSALLILQVHVFFPADPSRLVEALQALQRCCASTLVDHEGFCYLVELLRSVGSPSWRICVKLALAALLELSQDGPHYAKYQTGVVSKAAFVEPCLHALEEFVKKMDSHAKMTELPESMVDAASFFAMMLQRTTKTEAGMKLVRRLFSGKDLVSKLTEALRVVNAMKTRLPPASRDDIRFFALNADAVVQALTV